MQYRHRGSTLRQARDAAGALTAEQEAEMQSLDGARVVCFWEAEDCWYEGVLTRCRDRGPATFLVTYEEDGDVEEVELPDPTVRVVD